MVKCVDKMKLYYTNYSLLLPSNVFQEKKLKTGEMLVFGVKNIYLRHTSENSKD